MSAWNILKTSVDSALPTNGINFITASHHRTILKEVVDKLGVLQFAGIAAPTDSPGVYDGTRWFITLEPGTYTNFGALVVSSGELAFLRWDGTAWSKESINFSIGLGSFFKTFDNVVGDSIDVSTYNDLPDPDTVTEDSVNASIECWIGSTRVFFKNVIKSDLKRGEFRINHGSETIEFDRDLDGKVVRFGAKNFYINI